MVYFLNILIIFVLSVASLSFFPSLGLSEATPLLPVFFVIAMSYFRKGFEPLFLAIFSGLMFDFSSPYPFGLYTFLFLIAAVIVRLMFQEGMKELSYYNFMIWAAVISVIYVIAQVVILLTQDITISTVIINPIIWSIVSNLIFANLLYFGIVWYSDKIKVVENIIKTR